MTDKFQDALDKLSARHAAAIDSLCESQAPATIGNTVVELISQQMDFTLETLLDLLAAQASGSEYMTKKAAESAIQLLTAASSAPESS